MKSSTIRPVFKALRAVRFNQDNLARLCLGASLLLSEAAWGQAAPEPCWEWAAAAAGPNYDAGAAAVLDAGGHTVVAGPFVDSIRVGTNVLASPLGYSGFFVARYDPAGQVLWAQAGGTSGHCYGFRLAVDTEGHVLLTGLFRGQFAIGPYTLSYDGWHDCIVIVKFHRDGRVLWAQQADGVSEDSSFASTVDPAGNVYLTGALPGNGQIGSIPLFSRGGHDVFVAKLDPAGAVLWVQQAGGPDLDESRDLAVDGAGHVYVTGSFSGTAQFDETHAVTSAGGSQDVFLAKYDAAGRLVWVTRGGGPDRDLGQHLKVDAAGRAYLAGTFRDTATFGSVTLNTTGEEDIFLVQFAADGQVTWARGMGGIHPDVCHAVRVDAAGNTALAGFFVERANFGDLELTSVGPSDLFVARYDSAGGLIWAANAGDNEDDYRGHLALDALGHVYLAANYRDSATIGTNQLSGPSGNALFVAKYDSTGQVLWVQQATSPNYGVIWPAAMLADAVGNLHLVGEFDGDAVFGSHVLTNCLSRDAFVAKLTAGVTAPVVVVQPASLETNVGTTARFHATGAGTLPLTFVWRKDGEPIVNGDRITGADAASLTIRQLESGDAGTYTVQLTDDSGASTDAGATLTVDPQVLPPRFLFPPLSQTATRGETVILEAWVAGSEPLSYLWRCHDTNLPGATSGLLTLTNVQRSQAGEYSVVVSNAAGTVTGAVAVLHVLQAISLTEALDAPDLVWRTDGYARWFGQETVTHDGVDAAQSGFIDYEQSTWIATTVTGPGVISFRWKIVSPHDDDLTFEIGGHEVAAIDGQTDWQRRSFVVPDGLQTLRWMFTTEEVGSLSSRTAWLDEVSFTTHPPGPPAIVVPPRSVSAAEGDDLLFDVQAEGIEPLSYVWQRNGEAVSSDQNLRITSVTPAQAGAYTVVVTSPAGMVTSPMATLTVGPPIVAWEWARTAACTDSAEAPRLAVDGAGNLYLAGLFWGTADFGTNRLTSRGGADMFLSKYNRAGQLLWARRAGGPEADRLGNLALDPAGQAILSGFISDGADLGPFTLATSNASTMFLAKYDADGQVLWAKEAGTGNHYSERIAVDQTGNIYLYGQFHDAWFGGFHLEAINDNPDLFLAKYDSAGNVLWARKAGGPNSDAAHDLAVDAAGRAYVSGTFEAIFTLGTTNLHGQGEYPPDCFLAQFDPDGNVLWARLAPANQSSPYNLAIDAADRLYLCAYFYDTLVLGPHVLTAAGADDFFLAQCDPAGEVTWARKIEGLSNDYTEDVLRLATDSAGNAYVRGDFRGGLKLEDQYLFTLTNWWPGEAFVAKYSPAGDALWARRVAGNDPYSDHDWRPSGFAVDAGGGVHLSGTFRYPIAFGPHALTPACYRDIYLAKLGCALRCTLVRADLTDGQCRVRLSGLAGRSPVVIEASTDLLNWIPLCTNTAPCQTFEFAEPLCPNQPARFYRAVVP